MNRFFVIILSSSTRSNNQARRHAWFKRYNTIVLCTCPFILSQTHVLYIPVITNRVFVWFVLYNVYTAHRYTIVRGASSTNKYSVQIPRWCVYRFLASWTRGFDIGNSGQVGGLRDISLHDFFSIFMIVNNLCCLDIETVTINYIFNQIVFVKKSATSPFSRW